MYRRQFTGIIAVVLWLVCTVGFVLAGLGVFDLIVPTTWWRPLAVGFSALSLVTLGLYWQGFPVLIPNKVGAIAVDVVLIVGIVVGVTVRRGVDVGGGVAVNVGSGAMVTVGGSGAMGGSPSGGSPPSRAWIR
jgi:hypothetical protein